MNKIIFTFLIFFMTASFVNQTRSQGAERVAVEAISDVDFDYLQKQPTLDWGPSPFSKKPGFAAFDPALDEISIDQFKLGGIIFDSRDPVAIINGETVGVGDDIDGLVVDVIKPNYVIISGDGNRFELSLGVPKEAKQSAEIRPYRPSEESDE
jgi:hypothetical protein